MQNELANILKDYKYAGLNVLTSSKDYDIKVNCFGYADLDTKKPLTKDTIFRIASVSKVIVALCIMKLVEEKKLDIYEDVSKYLGFKLRNPNFPDKKITLEMIMTQTSSLNDGYENPERGYDAANSTLEFVSLEEMLSKPGTKFYTTDTFLNCEPGSRWQYSNLGCGVLACIIEKVTNEYFTDYVRRVLLKPLGIDGSFRVEDIENKDLIATLYYQDNNELVKSRDLPIYIERQNPRYPLGNNFRLVAGGLFISIENLAKIMELMMHKGTYKDFKFLEPATIDLMEQVHWEGISPDPSYKKKGLQLNLIDGYTKETLKGHFGNAYGLRSYMLYTRDYGYIYISNGAVYPDIDLDHQVELQDKVLKAQIKSSLNNN